MPIPLIGPVIGFFKWAFTATTFYATLARSVILMAGSLLLSRLMAPVIRDPGRSKGFAFGPQTTEGQGEAIAVTYGTNRVHANIVGHYISVDSVTTESGLYLFGLPLTTEVVKRTHCSRHILACFGEGPWQAPDDSTIRLNGRPLSDTTAVTATWRLGTVDQAVLSGWSAFRQDYNVAQELHTDVPVTFTLPKAGWDDLQVHIQFPQGAIKFDQEGGTVEITVSVKIEVGDADADTWQTIAHAGQDYQSRPPIRMSYAASGTYAGGTPYALDPSIRPHVRVTRTTSEYNSVRVIDKCELATVQVVKNVGFTHPGMVLLDLSGVPTELTAGGVTELSVETSGKVVADGAGGFAPSRYHADAIRDCLTQPVIEGDGTETGFSASYYRALSPSQIVESGFTDHKTVADQLVPDGNGNDVAMLRCDAVIQSGTSVQDAVAQIAASGRCGLSYLGNTFGLWTETTRSPVGILCDGCWERGSAALVPIEGDDLASEVSSRFRDADAGYHDRTILVTDPQIDTLTSVMIELAATTRTHEAARLARRELARNRLLDSTLSCRGDIDLAVYEPLDVLYAQIDGRSLGGRLVAVAGLVLTLDRDMTEVSTGADRIIVQVRDPVTQVQSVESKLAVLTGTRTVTVADAWSVAPEPGDVFLFGPAGIEDDQFEVTEISLDERLYATVSLARYPAGLDALDALDPDVAVSAAAVQQIYPQHSAVRPTVPDDMVAQIAQDPAGTFAMANWVFYNTGGSAVGWEPYKDADGESVGYVRCEGVLYHPAADAVGTTDRFIYWDPSAPTVFGHTDDSSGLAGMYLVAINESGTPYEKGGLLIGLDGTVIDYDDVADTASYVKMTVAERARVAALSSADEIVTYENEIVAREGDLVTYA